MDLKILGSGCSNCQTLEQRTREALAALGLDARIEHVTDPGEIASYGVLRTPGLVRDDDVLVSGRVPTAREIGELLRQP